MGTRWWGAFGLVLAAAGPAAAGGRTYTVDAGGSAVTIHVGKAGLFKFAGHEHEVMASAFEGEIHADPGDLARSSVTLVFETAALKVSERGEPPRDVPKVQETMAGPKVLDVVRFPKVTFESRSVSGRKVSEAVHEVRVAGDLTLHGVTRSLTVPLRVEVSGDTLVATGQVAIRHTDFGLEPISVGGLVKVKNELGIEFRILARTSP